MAPTKRKAANTISTWIGRAMLMSYLPLPTSLTFESTVRFRGDEAKTMLQCRPYFAPSPNFRPSRRKNLPAPLKRHVDLPGGRVPRTLARVDGEAAAHRS